MVRSVARRSEPLQQLPGSVVKPLASPVQLGVLLLHPRGGGLQLLELALGSSERANEVLVLAVQPQRCLLAAMVVAELVGQL
jgi:hypothetical protein